jgi:hypothetical protein
MGLNGGDTLPRRHIPQLDRSIPPGGSQGSSIGGKRNGNDCLAVPLLDGDAIPTLNVPKEEAPFTRSSGQRGPIG